MENTLVTGAAGFIGYHVSKDLLKKNKRVVGVDNLNDYYDVELKKARLNELNKFPNFKFYKKDISEKIDIGESIDKICHLAAQAGVRYSIKNPFVYEKSNILGTLNIFEFAKEKKIPTVVFASSSSVYGNSENVPFREDENIDKPISLYAATKKSNELMAYYYHNLYGINMTGLRFFTVYGPHGRPDMAPFKFTKRILEGEKIDVYNYGKMKRDFTYIDDIVSGVVASLEKGYPYEIINLARGETVGLENFIKEIEKSSGKRAKIEYKELQPGDVLLTSGDITKARELLGYDPKISISEGVKKTVNWYKEFYQK